MKLNLPPRLRVDWRDLVYASDKELLLAAVVSLAVFAGFVLRDEAKRLDACQRLLDAYGAANLPPACITTASRWGTPPPPLENSGDIYGSVPPPAD